MTTTTYQRTIDAAADHAAEELERLALRVRQRDHLALYRALHLLIALAQLRGQNNGHGWASDTLEYLDQHDLLELRPASDQPAEPQRQEVK